MGGQGLVVILEKGKHEIRVEGLSNLAIESCSHGWKVWSK
jgi:hypothetical protein